MYGRLSDASLSQMTDEEVEAALTEVPGIGPWTAHGFLIVALDRPDVLLPAAVASLPEPCRQLPVRGRV